MNRKALRDLVTIIICILLFFIVTNANAGGLFSFSFTPGGSLSDGLIAHYTFDGTDLDWGTGVVSDVRGGNNGSMKGTISTSTASEVGITGQALSFDGVDDYVDVPSISGVSDSYTLSVWTKPAKLSAATTNTLFGITDATNNHCFLLESGSGTTNQVRFYRRQVSSGSSCTGSVDSFYSDTVLTTDVWWHVVIVYDGVADVDYIYINGALDKQQAAGGDGQYSDVSLKGAIGRLGPTNSSRYVDGLIDDIRIYNRALSSDEVSQLYNMNDVSFYSGYDERSNLLAEYTFDTGTIDFGSSLASDTYVNNFDLTTVSLSSGNQVDGWSDMSVLFDGSADYMRRNLPTEMKTQNFSYSAWVYRTSDSGGVNVISAQPRGSYAAGRGAFINAGPSGASLVIGEADGSFFSVTGGAVTAQVWHHLVGTYDGSVARIYLDGVEVDSDTPITVAWSDGPTGYPTPAQLYIGGARNNAASASNVNANTGFFNGRIDEVRIYNRALTAGQVSDLYNFQAPIYVGQTSPVISGGLVAHYTFDGQDTDWSAGTTEDLASGNSGTLTGLNIKQAPVDGVIGQGLSLGASSDSVEMGNILTFADSQSFSMGAWFNVNSFSNSNQVLISRLRTSDGLRDDYGVMIANQTTVTYFNDNLAADIYTDFTVPQMYPEEWHYLAFVAHGDGTVSMYFDGVLISTESGAHGNYGSTDFIIGRTVQGGNDTRVKTNFNGSIDDVRIYNRALSASEITTLYNMGN